MTQPSDLLVDVVNFNADASCLSAFDWLSGLEGGQRSRLCRWISLYVKFQRPVVLGLTGATVADMLAYNPESIAMINAHRNIFQLIVRPFSHDAALLRTPHGFAANFLMGKLTLERAFGSVAPYFLPPEFMLTPDQVGMLQTMGIDTTFINAERYGLNQRSRVPAHAYRLIGPLGSWLGCIPFHEGLTRAYLEALDQADATTWNDHLSSIQTPVAYCWRDGESSFIFPQGLARERLWLEQESARTRGHLSVRGKELEAPSQNTSVPYFKSYPVHSLSAWMKEFRMLGYIQRVLKAEERVDQMNAVATGLWLQCINSDVLSSVEKNAVTKKLVHPDDPDQIFTTVFHRSERGFEGSECLLLLEAALDGKEVAYLHQSETAHIQKLRGRIRMLAQLMGNRSLGKLITRTKHPKDLR